MNTLIVRIAEGLGNQMFMYAHAFALSKKINYKLLIDNKSAFFKKKDIKSYQLHNFNISAEIANEILLFDNNIKNLKRKFLINLDKFKSKKKFLIEDKGLNKITEFYHYNTDCFLNNVYVEGHFECEKYFIHYKNDLKKEFSIKKSHSLENNLFFNNILQNNENIVSICIRQNRFSERFGNYNNPGSLAASEKFTKDTIDYVYRAIKDISNKINKPEFYVWSDSFKGLREYFPENKFIFVDNKDDKTINDFFLLTKCKNFIVGPTSFHWWGAWLSDYQKKICYFPKNINPSKNKDFWPENWTEI